jgi:hypothetical protein
MYMDKEQQIAVKSLSTPSVLVLSRKAFIMNSKIDASITATCVLPLSGRAPESKIPITEMGTCDDFCTLAKTNAIHDNT